MRHILPAIVRVALVAALFVWRLPRRLIALLITIYQHTLSPDHGPLKSLFPHGYCRFHPTCSEYGKQAILKYGVILGVPKTIWRIFRCNPWNPGGIDKP